jgi:simple sugar transport system substrate-binding protein
MQFFARWSAVFALIASFALVAAACGDSDSSSDTTGSGGTTDGEMTDGDPAPSDFKVGMILVGPQNDTGWSQAHYEGGLYLIEQLGLPEENLIVLDTVNTADRPETTVESVVDDMVDQGAQLVIATSEDMREGILAGAANHPDVPMIWASGDSAWAEGENHEPDLTNLGNIMGQMEYGKMIAGCSAALSSATGKIGYVGALINDETRRLVNSAYLGAKTCWENAGNDAADLSFEVKWIGFWFNIPGVTLDPTQVVDEFIADDVDVLISGIDTTEALTRAGQEVAAGNEILAVPYDFEDACEVAPDACIGVPYFNWGPSYLETARSVIDDSFSAEWQWVGPDWADIENPDTSAIGWRAGSALDDSVAGELEAFITSLGDGSLKPWTGPLNAQDGSEWLADGEVADDNAVWYTKVLLEGIVGASNAE